MEITSPSRVMPVSPKVEDISPVSEVSPVVEGGVSGENGGSGSIFVGKLAFDCRTRELEELFGKYGRITRCDIKKGYAFIEFEDARDANDAIKYLDGSRFLGMNITVERTKNERRVGTNPDGTRNRDCFKCGKSGHYARECGREGGDGRRRYERSGDRDRYVPTRGGDRNDRGDRGDRYSRRSRSPRRYERRSGGRDYSPRRRDSRSRSPIASYRRDSPRSRSPIDRRARSRSPSRSP